MGALGRKVSVGLEADVAQYIPPVKASVKVTTDLNDKVQDLDQSLNKIPPDAAKAGANLIAMGEAAEGAGRKTEKLRDASGRFVRSGTELSVSARKAKEEIDGLGDEVDDLNGKLAAIPADAAAAAAALRLLGGDVNDVGEKVISLGEKNTGLAVLDAKIREAAKGVRELGAEFVKTSDVEVFKNLSEAEAKLRSLQDVRKKLAGAVVEGAEEADTALKELGDTADAVGKKVSTIGSDPNGAAALTVLDSRIRGWQREIRRLGDEFERTGDIDIFRKLGNAEGRLAGLRDVRKKLASALADGSEDAAKIMAKVLAKGGTQAGMEFGKLFSGGLTGALGTPVLGPVIASLLIAAAAAAAPVVGAAVGGALLAGGAAAAAGGGLVGAWLGDPKKYGALWEDMLGRLKARFLDSSVQQFSVPLEESLREVDRVLRDLPIERIAAISKGFAVPLVSGFGRGITEAADGLADFLASAQPIVDRVGPELAELGGDIGMALREIGSESKGGAAALGDLLDVIGAIIQAIGAFVGVAEELYSANRQVAITAWDMAAAMSPAADAVEQLIEKALSSGDALMTGARALGDFGDKAILSADNLAELSQQLNSTALSADSLAGQMVGKIFDATMSLDQATLAWHQSLLAVSDSLQENDRNLDINTEKGIANREAILGAVTANMQIYQAQLAAGMSAADAAANYDVNTAALEAQLRKAHLTQGEIDGLIGKYRSVPANVNTTIALNGLESAIRQLNETIRLINGIHDKTVYVTVKQVGDNPIGQSRTGYNFRSGGIRRAAAGMLIPPSDPGTTLVGEPQTGGEALIPLRGISQGRAMGLMQTVGNGYGLTVAPAHAPAAAPSAATAMDLRAMARAIRAEFEGMGVYMDNVRVGQLQGRQAELLRRGG